MVKKVKQACIILLGVSLLISSTNAMADYILDENGYLKESIDGDERNGYTILDEHGYAKGYIQKDGRDGYAILDSEGKAKGYYQKESKGRTHFLD